MNGEKWLLYGVAGIATYFLIKKFGNSLFPLSPQQTQDKFTAMNYASAISTIPNDRATFLYSGDTTYRFNAGDYNKLNFAQKFLLGTHIVPVSWVLG